MVELVDDGNFGRIYTTKAVQIFFRRTLIDGTISRDVGAPDAESRYDEDERDCYRPVGG